MKFAGVKTHDLVRVRIGSTIETRMVSHATPTMIYLRKLKFRRKDGTCIRPKRNQLSVGAFKHFQLVKGDEK